MSAYDLFEALVVYAAVAAAATYALWRLARPLRRRLGGRAGLAAADGACGGCNACGTVPRGCADATGAREAEVPGHPVEGTHEPLDTRPKD